MYSQQNLSSAYVGFAILCAIQIHNCTPNTLSIPETPWYHLTNKHPNMMDRFRYPFGTAVTIKRTGVSSTSFNTTRNEKGYIIGFTEQPNHATLVYIPTRRGHQKIFTRINAQPIRTSLLANEYVNDEVPEIEINENESLSTNTYNFSSTSTFEPGSPIPEQLPAEVSESTIPNVSNLQLHQTQSNQTVTPETEINDINIPVTDSVDVPVRSKYLRAVKKPLGAGVIQNFK